MNRATRFGFILTSLLALSITTYSHANLKRLLNIDKTLTILEPATEKVPIVNKGLTLQPVLYLIFCCINKEKDDSASAKPVMNQGFSLSFLLLAFSEALAWLKVRLRLDKTEKNCFCKFK